MDSSTNKALIPTLEAGPVTPGQIVAMPSTKAADYIYRIAAVTAGLALLATFI